MQSGCTRVDKWIFCISDTPLGIAHLFLSFQALDFLCNMLHPPSIINLSLSAFAFLLSLSLSLPGLQLSSAHSNKSLHPPLTPVPPQKNLCNTLKHTCALTHSRTQTHSAPGSSHKGLILINLLLYWCWVSLAENEGGEGEEGGGAGQETQRSPEGRRRWLTDCSCIIRTWRAEGDRQRCKVRHQQALAHAISIDNRTSALR